MNRRILGTVVAALCLAGLTACTTSTSPSAGSVEVTTDPAPPPGPTGAPAVGVTSLPPVPQGEAASFGDVGLAATVTGISPVDVKGIGPGEVNGSGVRVDVTFENSTSEPIDLGTVAVNAMHGTTPAIASDSAPSAPATGMLAPGGTANGVYVFRVSPEDAADLVVEMTAQRSANVVLIRR